MEQSDTYWQDQHKIYSGITTKVFTPKEFEKIKGLFAPHSADNLVALLTDPRNQYLIKDVATPKLRIDLEKGIRGIRCDYKNHRKILEKTNEEGAFIPLETTIKNAPTTIELIAGCENCHIEETQPVVPVLYISRGGKNAFFLGSVHDRLGEKRVKPFYDVDTAYLLNIDYVPTLHKTKRDETRKNKRHLDAYAIESLIRNGSVRYAIEKKAGRKKTTETRYMKINGGHIASAYQESLKIALKDGSNVITSNLLY